MVQIWENTSAIQAAIGDDWRVPPELPDEARVFIDFASVEHYELADELKPAPDPNSDRAGVRLRKGKR